MRFNEILKSFRYKISYKLASCIGLVMVADFLFYESPAGWTLGLFGFLLVVAVILNDRTSANFKYGLAICYAALGLCLALMETTSFLACLLFCITLGSLILAPRLGKIEDIRPLLRAILLYGLFAWARLLRDSIVIQYVSKRTSKIKNRKLDLIGKWLLPVGLSIVFIALFSIANPIIGNFMDSINWQIFAEYLSVPRILFWMFSLTTCWALIRPKFKQRRRKMKVSQIMKSELTLTNLVFNEKSILISLIAFNALFLIQNMMDITFLWAGANLPDNMTSAQYAHQGAYPLIVTAILAALFVLIALKPGSKTESMRLIRALVYVWVSQNIFLVTSSILRLTDYIEEYSLTYLRVTALVWMGLVAFGLLLIITRIYFKKTNSWLINANAAALYLTLYLCCFINFGSIIADYNVTHARETTGSGANLDVVYLYSSVGVDAIPALRWYEKNYPAASNMSAVIPARQYLESKFAHSIQDWRQMTFRDYRIQQYY